MFQCVFDFCYIVYTDTDKQNCLIRSRTLIFLSSLVSCTANYGLLLLSFRSGVWTVSLIESVQSIKGAGSPSQNPVCCFYFENMWLLPDCSLCSKTSSNSLLMISSKPISNIFFIQVSYLEALCKICLIFVTVQMHDIWRNNHRKMEWISREILKYRHFANISSVSHCSLNFLVIRYLQVVAECFWNIGEIDAMRRQYTCLSAHKTEMQW